MKQALLALCCVAASVAAQEDSFIADLDQRLARGGRPQVNTHLAANWATAMIPLNQRTVTCELGAVDLSLELARGAQGRVAQALGDSLRLATGTCMPLVLALMTRDEVPKYCRSVASWRAVQTARELRRRIATIESDEAMRSGERGQACRAAYLNELRSTRVGIRVAPPAEPKPAR